MSSELGQVSSRAGYAPVQTGPFKETEASEGLFQGNRVRFLPHADSVTEVSLDATELNSSAAQPLEAYLCSEALPPPTLVRHARYAPLPTSEVLKSLSDASDGERGLLSSLMEFLRELPLLGSLLGPADSIADRLDRYHAGLARAERNRGRTSTERAQNALLKALSLLRDLDRRAAEYDGSDPKRKLVISDLRTQIANERAIVQDLLNESLSGSKLHQESTLIDALAFARQGLSMKDMARMLDKGLQPHQAQDARTLLDSERINSLIHSPDFESSYFKTGFSSDEAILLELSGLGPQGGSEYRRLGIPINRRTIVKDRIDEARIGTFSKLGAGAFNEVYNARYADAEGNITRSVFKPLPETEGGWVAKQIGINVFLPQVANRNIATLDVARDLGFDVVVGCEIGSRKLGVPPGSSVQLGLVMDIARGKPAIEHETSVFELAAVRREVTKLQLLDHLVGQGDRHGNNYFIDVSMDSAGNPQVKVSGIDNDQCFGSKTKHADDIRYDKTRSREGFRGTRMPPVLDTDMALAIRSMTPEKLAALLGDKLSEAEINAAQSRLLSMQRHEYTLGLVGRVVTPQEWDSGKLLHLFDASNSYFAREGGMGRRVNFY